MTPTKRDALDAIHDELREVLPSREPLHVLEAGGGSYSHIQLDRVKHVTVLDISPEQLERNSYADALLLGDLEDPEAISGAYHLIVCWDVLEHLRHPEKAFANLARSLAGGGLFVIGCPSLWSLKGLVTKLTPHWFHIWYYRAIRGNRLAGEPGHAPFPTFLRPAMSFRSLLRLGRQHGLIARRAIRYAGPAGRGLAKHHPRVFALYRAPIVAVKILSLGRIDLELSDYIIVFQAPAETQP